jgi:hypothetical protein
MAADSELNICHEHTGVTGPLRKRLWEIHTGGNGAQADVRQAFKWWGDIIKKNKERAVMKMAPIASLIEFYREDPKRTYLD